MNSDDEPSNQWLPVVLFLSLFLPTAFVFIFIFQTWQNVNEGFLIMAGDGYPLTNGYNFLVDARRDDYIVGNGGKIRLGVQVNRIYIDDRYIIGEVYDGPREQADREEDYSFFVFDTQTTDYSSGMDESAFETKLKQLGIQKKVKLVDRDNRKWLRKQ